jgi:hypothetical protein
MSCRRGLRRLGLRCMWVRAANVQAVALTVVLLLVDWMRWSGDGWLRGWVELIGALRMN